MTAEDLPDATIQELAFLRKAELTVYNQTKKTESEFDTESSTDTELRDRFRIATMYRTAALLVPSLPQIVREEYLSELRAYSEIDWQERINFFISEAGDAVAEDIPPDAQVSSVGTVATSWERYTAF